MLKILVSAYLLDDRVRYNGSDVPCESDLINHWQAEGRIITFCPEVAGGFSVPRPAAEIVGRDGFAVLDGKGQVLDVKGHDDPAYFIDGAAARALEAARRSGVKLAILKEGSPSCGSTYINDGTFSSMRKAGQGVTAAPLERNGIRVFSEEETEEAADYIAEIEGVEPKCT